MQAVWHALLGTVSADVEAAREIAADRTEYEVGGATSVEQHDVEEKTLAAISSTLLAPASTAVSSATPASITNHLAAALARPFVVAGFGVGEASRALPRLLRQYHPVLLSNDPRTLLGVVRMVCAVVHHL